MILKSMITTQRFTMEDTDKVVTVLKKGGIVGLPTETVYGLAADAEYGVGVQRIYDKKNRDYDKPVSILVTGMDMVEKYCSNIPKAAYALAEKYWPGPLTMILEDNGTASKMVTAYTGTLGVRCPDHPVTLQIIGAFGHGLAAPSANPSGMEPATTAQGVVDYFDGNIEGVVNGGTSAQGVASTIVDLTGEEPKILREGGIPGQEILDLVKANS